MKRGRQCPSKGVEEGGGGRREGHAIRKGPLTLYIVPSDGIPMPCLNLHRDARSPDSTRRVVDEGAKGGEVIVGRGPRGGLTRSPQPLDR